MAYYPIVWVMSDDVWFGDSQRNETALNQRLWRVHGPGPAWQVYRACRHHSRRPLRLAHPRPQRVSDRNPARRRTQERPRQCSPPRHCSRAFQSRRHSSVDPVPTPGRSHGRAPLSQLRSGLLPPHRHVYPRTCQRNQKKVKHD